MNNMKNYKKIDEARKLLGLGEVATLKEMKESYRFNVWGSVIPIDTKFRDASKLGLPLPTMAPYSRGSLAYKKLLNFLLGIHERDKDAEKRQHKSA